MGLQSGGLQAAGEICWIHIIALNESHLKRLLTDYIGYYHDDRTHLGLGKGTPGGRIRAAALGCVVSHERPGGLHHRYDRAA
jgi:putative transposase